MYRRGSYIAARLAGLLAVLIGAALLAIQTPYVQTRLTNRAIESLTEVMDGRILYGEMKVMPSGALLLKDVLIIDSKPYVKDEFCRGWAPVDTVFRAGTLTATFSLPSIFRPGSIRIGRVSIDDGFFHLASEPADNRKVANVKRIFGIKKSGGGKKSQKGELFSISKLRVSNFRFRLNNFGFKKRDYGEGAINYDDLDIRLSLEAHGIRMSDGKVTAYLDKLQLREKSGYQLRNLKARCTVGPGKTVVEDIRLVDLWSDVRMKSYSMSYDGTKSFKHYKEEVLMEGELSRSTLSMHTLSYFAKGRFRNSPTLLDISRGHFRGYVNDFKVTGLRFTDLDSKVSAADVECSMTGLPGIANVMTSIKVKGLKSSAAQACRLLSGISSAEVSVPDGAVGERRFTLDLRAAGPVSRLTAGLSLRAGAGRASVDADIRNLADKRRKTEIRGHIRTSDLNLGEILGMKSIGECSLYAEAAAVLTGGLPQLRVDSLRVDSFDAFGYGYRDISASASLLDSTARLRLVSTDPNFKISLEAAANLPMDRQEANYKVDGRAESIDLNALAIDRRWNTSKTAFDIRGDVDRKGQFFDGFLDIRNFRLGNGDGEKNVGDMELKAYLTGDEQCLSLDSPFADLFLSGSGSFTQFIEDIQNASIRKALPSLYADSAPKELHGRYDFDLLLHDSRAMLSYAVPGLYIADSTRASFTLSSGGALAGELSSSRIAFGTTYLKDTDLRLDNRNGRLNATVTGQEFKSGGFDVKKPDISISAGDDAVALSARFEGFSRAGGAGEINVGGEFYRDSSGVLVVRAHPLDSYVSAGDGVWNIRESDIVLRGNDIYFKDFRISNGEQSISLDGGVSKYRRDTLALDVNRIDLSQIDDFLPGSYGIRGIADGKALLTSQAGRAKGMLMDIRLDSLYVGQANAGNIRIASILEEQGEDIDIYIRNELDGRNAFSATGMYFLDDGRMDLGAEFDRLPLATASPFLTGIFSEIDGSISGALRLQGMLGNLSVTSSGLTLNDALIRLAYTGVPYTLSGPLRLDESGMHFDSLRIRDDNGGSGEIAGAIRYDHLSDFILDSRISFNNLKLVDTEERESGIYGQLRASGSASVSGPFSSLSVTATASTVGDGSIHVPLSGGSSGSTGNLLTFTEPKKRRDPYEEMLVSYSPKPANASDIDIHATLKAHPGLKAFVEFDKDAGNVASFSGEGNIGLHLRPSKAIFDINGDFNLSEGNYQFVIPGILSKGFSVEQGSSIKFGGDIADTELDVNVIYSLRTSLTALIADESSIGSKRLVECGISISDRLKNPKIDFSIDIPDLDPTTKSQVDGALSTADKVQKQFMALLLMGAFIPDESSGVVNGSEILVSNMTELMSNQLNSILQKLEIPIDVGIGYQGAYQGTNMFDVAISTQLFNNRVIVGGSVANRKYNNTASSGDMAGDLDIQIKLDDEGKFRLNLFSHSADEYTSYLDLSQRNGVGVSYQKEYGRFREFWRSLFGRRKKDSESGKVEETTIIIENEQTVSDSGTAGE